MKGQKLFVRAVEPGDAPELRAFYLQEQNQAVPERFETGSIAKLLGRIVCHVAHSPAESGRRQITRIQVARELRGKQVGRASMQQIEQQLKEGGTLALVVDGSCFAAGFFQKIGFTHDGETLVRPLTSHPDKGDS